MDMSIRFPGLGFEFGYVPTAFRIAGVEFSLYGILIAAGMLMGLAVMMLEAKRAKENMNQCLFFFIWSIVGGIVGARLLYAGFSWKQYQDNYLELFRIDHGGMAFYGGILGAMLMTAVYCYVRKVSFLRMADYACLGLVTAQMIGRWGDFFNRESFGEYTENMFRMQLPLASVRTGEVTVMMRENLITDGGVSYVLVHPTFFYESIWCLILLLVLLGYMRRRKFDGEIFMRYLAGYGLGRAVIEWLRTDQLLIPRVGISVSLVISVLFFFIFGIMAVVERSMMKKREKLRKRRNEAYYEEERIAAEQDEKLSPEKIAEIISEIEETDVNEKETIIEAEKTESEKIETISE